MDFVYDVLNGFVDSVRFDLYISNILYNERSRNTLISILKHNLLFIFVPYLLMSGIEYVEIPVLTSLLILQYPLFVISNIIHLVYYHNLGTQHAASRRRHTNRQRSAPNPVVISIVMSIYQLVIYLTMLIIQNILSDSMKLLSDTLVFVIWTIYYSIYSYNSLWQQMSLTISQRIHIHEEKWAYFLGYAAVISTLNQYSHPLLKIVYNIYLTHLLMIPYEREGYFANRQLVSYPSLNLGCFSYVLKKITTGIKYVLSVFI